MSSQLTISIALTTFNGERFLSKQLESLSAQTHIPLELVVVDDGSTDKTLEILESFAIDARFPVRIYQNAVRIGYRKNFIRAANLCSGDLICFCDQDDIWSEDKLERVAIEFLDQSVLLVYHNARLIDANGQTKGYIFKSNDVNATRSHEDFEPWAIVPGFSQCIRKSLLRFSSFHLDSVDMFNMTEPMPHDQWFIFLASALGKTNYIADSLADYRQHDRNTSGWLQAKPLAFALHNIVYASFYVRACHHALQNRIALLNQLKPLLRTSQGEHVDTLISHYTDLMEYVRRRLVLYTEKSFCVRARLLYSMIRNRTYSSSKARFRRGSMLLDIVIGVPLAHTLR